MSKVLGIDIKTLDDGGFQFYQTGLIGKVSEATGMEHFNMFTLPTKFGAPVGTDINASEAKIDWTNAYYSVIDMLLYLASNIRPDI